MRADRYRSRRFIPRLELLEDRQLLTLDPLTQPRFVNPLPVPAVMRPTEPGGTHYEVGITQFQQELGIYDPVSGLPFRTTVWGYNGTYPGATFEAHKGTPITVRWSNNLQDGTSVLPHLFEVNTEFHWADPPGWPASGVPLVTHLHGGHTASASDGLPEAWFTPGFGQVGSKWVQDTYTYANDQEAATLWYHDHTLGITRLNVYAGLAGAYLVRDAQEEALNLPRGDFEVPLVLQDRIFSDTGQLAYLDPIGMRDGFFGDFMLVNGKAWPYLEVEPRKYRFRLLNGSDSRFYELSLAHAQGGEHKFFHIGAEDGLLDRRVLRDRLRLAPGERADIVVDFSQLVGRQLVVRNTAPEPYPNGGVPDPNTVGQVMQFRVTRPLSKPDRSVVPRVLRQYPETEPAVRTRQLLLSQDRGMHGMMHMLGTVAEGRMRDMDPATETPGLNDVEVWEFYNSTSLSHPIHLHLVSFRVLNQQEFTAEIDSMTGALQNIQFPGPPKPYGLDGAGLKDTIVVNPGQVVRVIATFDRAGEYVWHCHMLTHEDHEMMRPLVVGGGGPGGAPGAPPGHRHGLDPSAVAQVLDALTRPRAPWDSVSRAAGERALTAGSSPRLTDKPTALLPAQLAAAADAPPYRPADVPSKQDGDQEKTPLQELDLRLDHMYDLCYRLIVLDRA